MGGVDNNVIPAFPAGMTDQRFLLLTRKVPIAACCILLLLFLPQRPAQAAFDVETLQLRAERLMLYRNAAWLALGHYRTELVGGGYAGEADDRGFFLASEGKYDPRAELRATIAAIMLPGNGDTHPRCRFPARYHWLGHALSVNLPPISCPALEEWRTTLNADGVTLIFPTAYLNSPSSMFGHTLLRLDRPGQNDDNARLAWSINYAAHAEDENELFYAWKGLFGGYPGRTTVQPYYLKIREYHNWENRDIWEYRLNLSRGEVDQLVRHVWEIMPTRFDYFFVGENCSYRILSLLDVTRPNLRLAQQFPIAAIPADTVRALVAAGLVADTRFRPSAASILSSQIEQLNADERSLSLQLAYGERKPEDAQTTPDARQLNGRESARVLETAYDFLRYRVIDEKLTREENADASLSLLRARSKLNAPADFIPPERPAVRDDQGHGSSRVSLGGGYYDGQAFGELELRAAYHDLTDPWPGYRKGAQITFLDADLRYYQNSGLMLESAQLFSIRSLSPRNDFFKPLSWGVAVGAQRRLTSNGRPLAGYADGNAGFSYDFPGGMVYGQIGASLEVGGEFTQGVNIALGPRVGWLYRGLGGQGLLSFDSGCYLIEQGYCAGRLGLLHTVNLSNNLAVTLDLARQRGQNIYANELDLRLQYYF
ncbi:DUF4105 domain-containing protein [Candidatus Methylospira mobilis]|uniref:DUF4105 domain-containing protein n=1 Tax=Candidatus Methylospira mobilis TaxID=1808979 RepID=A0A5Q0BMM7_9GAMM|nr:DUF4105 domain-containing protein [Candidatus Methylospira mobilis]QFY44859.1 DUF4105 domain-containing protein [Candidatus Methylospira mobilis]